MKKEKIVIMLANYLKSFYKLKSLNILPRSNFSTFIEKKPYIPSLSENETFSKLFESKKEKPLGRWCTPISSSKCNPEIKADNANEDNGPGLNDNYTIIATKKKKEYLGSLFNSSNSDSKNIFETDMMTQINKDSLNSSKLSQQNQTNTIKNVNFDNGEDSLLMSYYSQNTKA